MTDEELREMQERVVQIRELQQHRSWPIYEDWLRHRLQQHQKRILAGNIEDIPTYRHQAGIVAGLTTAIVAANEIEEIVNRELEFRAESLA